MSLQRLARRLIWLMTRPALRRARRRRHAFLRRLTGREPTVHYFHQADDPYGHLCLQVLSRLAGQYRVRIQPHLVGPPSEAAAPDRARLAGWSARDAVQLAQRLGLEAPGEFAAMGSEVCAQAESALVHAFRGDDWMSSAAAVSRAAWLEPEFTPPGTAQPIDAAEVARAKAQGNALRASLGHYLGAMFQFEGEWYWGLDRLHYLEQRLREAGLCVEPAQGLIAPVPAVPGSGYSNTADKATREPAGGPDPQPEVHFFLSFRSPYTYLAAARVRALAAHHGARLVLRPVLPMVMRGLPVPLAKRLYIVGDVAREAERLGLPYGLICDPVGRPVERGYAVLYRAMAAGKGEAFVESFLQGVWSEGADAGRDADLHRLAERVGLTRSDVSVALADEAWRAPVEANRQALLDLGLWGVPSFQLMVNGRVICSAWGQDRLWQIDEALQSLQAT